VRRHELTDEQWASLKDLLQRPSARERPRSDLREVLNAIFSLLRGAHRGATCRGAMAGEGRCGPRFGTIRRGFAAGANYDDTTLITKNVGPRGGRSQERWNSFV
jgi:transposase